MTDELRPQRNAVAVCSMGHVGLIEGEHPLQVPGSDPPEFAWLGREISPPDRIGIEWSSRNPTVLYVIPDIIAPRAINENRDATDEEKNA